jgi:hypothetical protein
MTETLILTPPHEQKTPLGAIEGLAQLALQGATSTSERGDFTLSEETEAELRTVFDLDPSQELPLSAHGLGCDDSDEGGEPHHAYLLPGYKPVAE